MRTHSYLCVQDEQYVPRLWKLIAPERYGTTLKTAVLDPPPWICRVPVCFFVPRYGKGVQDKIHLWFSGKWWKSATADGFAMVENLRNHIILECCMLNSMKLSRQFHSCHCRGWRIRIWYGAGMHILRTGHKNLIISPCYSLSCHNNA